MPNAARIAAQVRVARPTDQLEAVVAFYRDALGLRELARFEGHAGYDGVILGLPGHEYHLEFTTHAAGSPGRAPSDDNLLVLYVGDNAGRDVIAASLRAAGHEPVAAANPYWEAVGALTFADPDGWRVVLVPNAGV
jgi:catechol 2,3-dioxygenase-like lactoylglutathione lyase family enzyme